MVYGIWRLFPFQNVEHLEFIYIVAFTAVALGLIYAIDFMYKLITKNKKDKSGNKHEPSKDR